MKRTSLQDQIKKTITPIIRGRLLKVNRWEDARICFNELGTSEQIEIMDEVQNTIDKEIKKQFDKIQKAKSLTRKI